MNNDYKQTEAGLIPEDWTIKHLNDFGDVISGGTPSTSVKEYWNGKVAWCTPSDITKTQGKYISATERTISKVGLKNSAATLLPEKSILLCTRATIGELKISAIPMTTNQGFKNLRSNGSANIEYLYYLLQTKKGNMLELSIGSTFLEISKSALCSIPIQTPPIAEQNRIAEALSDVDGMIYSLEKLIAKKKAIKQGAMQELLTGKRRLPGFIKPWKKESNFFTFIKGTQINGELLKNDLPYPVFNGGMSASGYTSSYNCENTVIISEGGNSCGYVNYIRQKFWAGGHCYYVTASKVMLVFLYQLLKYYEKEIMALRVGSGLPNIQKDNLSKMYFSYPEDEKEQNAILEILMDMDSEIEVLEQKLDKTRHIKQGMMQQLLTGKIRLV